MTAWLRRRPRKRIRLCRAEQFDPARFVRGLLRLWLRTIDIAEKRHLPGALANVADDFAVGVQVAVSATFRASAAQQRAGAVARGAGNLDGKRLESCAVASRAFDKSWPSHK
jgi:hypothetical protein